MIATCRMGPLGGHVDGLDQWEGSEEELAMRKSGEAFSFLHTV
jgi:hypothetical protein